MSGSKARVFLFTTMILLLFSLSFVSANPFLSSSEQPEEEIQSVRSGVGGTSEALTEIQFDFREQAASYMQRISDDPSLEVYLALGLATFLYGLFHGAGPGHRKTIIFSLFIGKKARWWEPLAAGFLSAGVHAGVSLALILIFNFLIQGVTLINSTSTAGTYLEGGTYLLLIVLAFILMVLRIVKGEHHSQDHDHRRGIYSVIFVSSLIPCPGATMLLLFSLSMNLIMPGIFGLVCMSLGMGVVISAAGYLAFIGREGLFCRLKDHEKWFARISGVLEVSAYLFIIAFSLYMAWPFITSIADKLV